MKELIRIIIGGNQILLQEAIAFSLYPHGISADQNFSCPVRFLDAVQTDPVSIVLLDIEMKTTDGELMFRQVRRDFGNVKVIVLSKYFQTDVVLNYIKAGANGFVPLIADLDQLVTVIKNVHKSNYCFQNLPLEFRNMHNYSGELPAADYWTFSRRELEIMPLMFAGKTNKNIARELHIVEKTVEAHRRNIYQKTESSNVSDFIKYTIENGLNYFIH